MKIFVDIFDQEFEVTFVKRNINKHSIWMVDDIIFDDELVSIQEIDGSLNENSLIISLDITTPRIIVYERILDAFSLYKQELEAGFEPTEENDSDYNQIEPYNPDDIKVRRETFSVFEINRLMTISKDIDLNPDFQRNLVWDNTRKSALIESILLGIPIPVFYFAESKSGRYNVVDGLQRLSTIKQYLNNEFFLKKLEHLGEDCNSKYYMENTDKPITKAKYLDRKYTRRLENAQLIVNVIEYASPQKVKYDIFKRLNTGGRPLNKQEIRNCIASNDVRKFLKTCANSIEFLDATDKGVNDNRMDAQELVLRFIGFRLEKENKLVYGGDMNSFLDDTIDLINEYQESTLEKYKKEFLNSMRICHYLFGQYCFRKCLTEHLMPGARRQFVNKAMFVSWSMITFDLIFEDILLMIDFGGFSKELAKELDKKEKYYTILTTGTSDKYNLKDAITIGRELLNIEKII